MSNSAGFLRVRGEIGVPAVLRGHKSENAPIPGAWRRIMSKGFKRFVIGLAVAQLLLTTVVAYRAQTLANVANMKACVVAAAAFGVDYEGCVAAR